MEFGDFCLGVLIFLVVLAVFYLGVYTGREYGYKSGQIDAINNHIKYVLTTQPNGEKTWEERK